MLITVAIKSFLLPFVVAAALGNPLPTGRGEATLSTTQQWIALGALGVGLVARHLMQDGVLLQRTEGAVGAGQLGTVAGSRLPAEAGGGLEKERRG